MQIDRSIYNKIKEAILSENKQIVIIYGPRQAGKTTLVNEILSNIKLKSQYFTGDDLYAQEILGRNELENLKRIFSKNTLVFIDEAQKIKNIGLTLKLLHDNLTVPLVVSGSASFDLANKLSEPLTGRTKTFWLYPLSYGEIKEKYKSVSPRLTNEELLLYGMYPKVQTIQKNIEKEDYLYEYINKYLYQDILEFSGIKKPRKVVDLLTLLALQIGSEVSVAELAKNLTLSQKTIENYLDVLEKMFIIVNLRGFSRNLRKEIAKTSKYFFMDLGVRNALIRNFNPPAMRTDFGHMFENFFIMEKIKQAHNFDRRANFYFWRTYDQKEIDLIEEYDGKLMGYECKWSDKKNNSVPRDWKKAYPEANFEIVTPDNFAEKLN